MESVVRGHSNCLGDDSVTAGETTKTRVKVKIVTFPLSPVLLIVYRKINNHDQLST